MKKVIAFTVFILALFSFWGCESKTTAYGDLNEIIVLADSTEAVAFADTLTALFFPGRDMPVYEPSFKLKFITLQKLNEYKFRKNFLLVGTLESGNEMSVYLNRLLPEDFKTRVKSGDANFTYVPNLYAYMQNAYIFVARDLQDLMAKMRLRKEIVRDYIAQKYWKDLEASMFEAAEQKEVEEYLLRAYRMAIRIQHDYFIARQSQDSTFIWIRRFDPYREISRDILIRYYDNPDTIEFTPEWMLKQKDYNSQMVFRRREVVDTEKNIIGKEQIGKYEAVKIEGAWRTEDFQIGGPFTLYGFYVPELNRVVTIDLSLTAVGRRKTPYMDQMELIAKSFWVIPENKSE